MLDGLRWRRILWISTLEAGVLFALMACFFLLTTGVPSGSIYAPTGTTVAILGLAVVVTVFPLIRNYRANRDPFEPVVILGGIFFLYYPMNAIGIAILGFDGAFPATQAGSGRLLGAFTLAMFVITAGVCAFYVGYYGVSKRSSRPIMPAITNRKPVFSYLFIVWVASAALYLSMATGIVQQGNAFIGLLAGWHHYIPVAFVITYFRNESNVENVLSVVLLIAFEFAILTLVEFQLDEVLIQIILLTVAYHYVGPSLDFPDIAKLAGFVAVLFPIAAIVQRVQTGASLVESLVGQQSPFLSYVQAFVSRFIGTEALTLIVARTPEQVQYQHGETLLLIIYSFVPRVIWSGKPSIIMCRYNNIYFSGRGPDTGTCSAMTVPGELYWNFGAVGVIGGLFVFGIIVGLLYRWFLEQMTGETHPYLAILVYGIALSSLMKIEVGVAQMLSGMVKELVFMAIFFALVTRSIGGKTHGTDYDMVIPNSRTWKVLETILDLTRRVVSKAACIPLMKRIHVKSRDVYDSLSNVIGTSMETSTVVNAIKTLFDRFQIWTRSVL